MLHELDRWLEKKGMRYIRYADDFSIYTKTETTARKIGNQANKFLRDKLKLPINREKSGINRPVNFITFGFGFVPTYVKGEKGRYQMVVSYKSWKKLVRKRESLIRLGVEHSQAYAWSCSRMGGWATKRSDLTTEGSNSLKPNFRNYYYIAKAKEERVHLFT